MTDRLTGKRFLVTGGARRIGRAICLRLAAAGARVVVHYRTSAKEAEELIEELSRYGEGHEKVMCDLTASEECEKLIPFLTESDQRLDGLVNNASVYRRAFLAECGSEDVDADYSINFFAPFQLMRHFATCCDRGVIINMLDQRVSVVEPGSGTYALAKKSLRDATEAAAIEWAPEIRVNGVAPGFVLPPPGVNSEKMKPLLEQIPMQSRTHPEEVAEAAYFLATTQAITGQILFLDGGMHLGSPVVQEKQSSKQSQCTNQKRKEMDA